MVENPQGFTTMIPPKMLPHFLFFLFLSKATAFFLFSLKIGGTMVENHKGLQPRFPQKCCHSFFFVFVKPDCNNFSFFTKDGGYHGWKPEGFTTMIPPNMLPHFLFFFCCQNWLQYFPFFTKDGGVSWLTTLKVYNHDTTKNVATFSFLFLFVKIDCIFFTKDGGGKEA